MKSIGNNDVSTSFQKVVYAFPTSHKFRVPFHTTLKQLLKKDGVEYSYIFSSSDQNFGKNDTEIIEWANDRPCITIDLFGKRFFLHLIGPDLWKADLLILQQQNNLLLNFFYITFRRLTKKPVAYFGHGKNYQSENPNSLSEKLKRFWIRKVDWWFTYTSGSAQIVSAAGFPSEKITVFNNSIDTANIRNEITLAKKRKQEIAGQLPHNTVVYVGGMYPEKRIEFLIKCSQLVSERVQDFRLLLIGSGPDARLAQEAADQFDWIDYRGPLFGVEKSEAVLESKLWLMPGLVGLGVLDSFVYGIPMVTTSYPYHSPEFAYLENGVNGIVVEDWENIESYADAVCDLLLNESRRELLAANARKSADAYSVESMASRFASGVLEALRRSDPN